MNKLLKAVLITAVTIGAPLLVFEVWFGLSIVRLFG